MLGYLDFTDLILILTVVMLLASFGLFILWYKADKQVQSLRRRIAELESKTSQPVSLEGNILPYDTTADRL